MNTTTKAQRINKRQDAIWEAAKANIPTTGPHGAWSHERTPAQAHMKTQQTNEHIRKQVHAYVDACKPTDTPAQAQPDPKLSKIMREGVRDGWIEDDRTTPAPATGEGNSPRGFRADIDGTLWINGSPYYIGDYAKLIEAAHAESNNAWNAHCDMLTAQRDELLRQVSELNADFNAQYTARQKAEAQRDALAVALDNIKYLARNAADDYVRRQIEEVAEQAIAKAEGK